MRRRRATSGGLGWAQGTRGMEPPRLAPVEQALGGGFVAELGVLSYDKAAMECHGLGGLGYSAREMKARRWWPHWPGMLVAGRLRGSIIELGSSVKGLPCPGHTDS